MRTYLLIILLALATSLLSMAQNEPVICEAEAAMLGSDFTTATTDGITYITPKTDFLSGDYPGSREKVASFSVTFPDSGTYRLFARVRVGAENWNDDSYFYGNGFGEKAPDNANDWIMCNGLVTAGHIYPYMVVEGQGDAGTELFKWVAFSDFTGGETPITFRVEPGELNQTFELGARENGFDIDKIAFGREGIYYTVENLNNGEAGTTTRPTLPEIGLPLADGLDKFLGCGYSPGVKREFRGYWNQVTPGNAGKWGSVERNRDQMNWNDMDSTYNYAKEYGFSVKHHVLVWGNQQPGWIAELDSAEQREEIEEWFTAVAQRYPELDQVEVVNEPLHDPPDDAEDGGYMGALGGTGTTGWDWILEAFKIADTLFSDDVQLMINDYSIMNSTSSTDTYFDIITLLQEENLIDAIGFQAHGFSHTASNSTYLRNINKLASTGLPLYVTELDIDGLTDLEQVHNYMNLFPLLWEHPSIMGITLWGYEYGLWRNDAGAYLVDQYGNQRPAFKWLQAYVRDEFIPNESVIVSSVTGQDSIETGKTLQMEASFAPENSTLTKAHWSVSNKNIATISSNGLLTAVSKGTVTVKAVSLELGSPVFDEMEITITEEPSNTNNISANEIFTLFPNPASNGNFTVGNTQNMKSISILNMNGKQIFSKQLYGMPSVNIKLKAPKGMYMVRLFDGKQPFFIKLINR
ncbi:MAG: endo-1,4-beta-xylanase [Prolixibacteraceae bacterium]|nr:endo-1,4-beta-xylanase [Prolixibacteraceae bacterium]